MINKVILVGNVGTDPEVRSLEGGSKVARLRLATTERTFNRDTRESKEFTEWHTVVLWRGLADVVDRYVRKGSQLYIEGSLRTREWTDRDNQKRFSTEIVANEMKLLGRRNDNNSGSGEGYGNGRSGNSYGDNNGSNPAYGQGGGYNQGGYSQTRNTYEAPAAQTAPASAADDVDDLPF